MAILGWWAKGSRGAVECCLKALSTTRAGWIRRALVVFSSWKRHPELLDAWVSRWDDLIDFEVVPVLTSTDFWAETQLE